jgi:hypothetical protein
MNARTDSCACVAMPAARIALLIFSCNGRSFCGSCCGRRMADTAAYLRQGIRDVLHSTVFPPPVISLCQLRAFGMAIFTKRGYYVMGFSGRLGTAGQLRFDGRAKLKLLDNDRYPNIRWTAARDVLSARLVSFGLSG